MTKKTYRESTRVKPIGKAGIEKCRDIVKNGYAKVNEVMVDSYSASAITQVYDALGDENKVRLESLPVARAAELCFKTINKANKRAA